MRALRSRPVKRENPVTVRFALCALLIVTGTARASEPASTIDESQNAQQSSAPDPKTGKLTLDDKVGLYFDHFKRDHFGNDAWKSAFDPDDLALYGALGALAAGSTLVDTGIEHDFEDHKPLGRFRYADDILVVAFPVATASMILIDYPTGFERRYDDLATFSEVMIATGLVGGTMKAVFDRERPNGGETDSFPSFHAMISFATATYVHKTYGKKYGLAATIPAFLLAGLTTYPRMERERHFASDVMTGAALGIIISNVICEWHYSDGGINRTPPPVTVAPFVTENATGIAVNIDF